MCKRLLFLCALVIFLPRESHAVLADCNVTTIQNFYNAAVLAAATSVDIECPAGSFTWSGSASNALDFSSDISLRFVGAGNGGDATGACVGSCTLITDNAGGNAFRITAFAGRTYEVSGFRFIPTTIARQSDTSTGRIIGTTNNFKMYDMTFDFCGVVAARRSLQFDPGAITGVVYESSFLAGQGTASARFDIYHSSWGGKSNGDGSWMEDAQYGTSRFLFFEDNIFTRCVGAGTFTTPENQGGARIVIRFNNYVRTNGGAALHGSESGGRTRSPRAIELYHNTYLNNASPCLPAGEYRGGGLLAFNNTLSCYSGIWNPSNNRSMGNAGTWKADDGSMKFDLNDNVIYDQGTALASADNTLEVSGAPWSGVDWRGKSVRNCGAGPITETLISTCHAGTIASMRGSYIWTNDSNTIQFGDNGTVAGPSFVAGNVYLILAATKVMDAVGRGRGKELTGLTPLCPSCIINPELPWGHEWIEQVDEPVYQWNNLQCASNGCTPTLPWQGWQGANADFSNLGASGRGPHIIQNRDMFNYTLLAAFDGSSGVSMGTKAQLPATCSTAGAAFWVTNEGFWNADTPGVAAGQLYQCMRTDAVDVAENPTDRNVGTALTYEWRLWYTPYTYPHPFRSVAAPELTELSPNSGTRTQATVPVGLIGTGFNAGSFAIQIDDSCTGVSAGAPAGALDTLRTSTFTIADTAAGVCGVTVTTTAGTSTAQSFTVSSPIITAINPPAANQGETTAVTITGTTLSGASPVITISGTSITYNSLTCPQATACTVNFVVAASALPGSRTVTFATFDGSDDEIFEVFDVVITDKPVLDSITPASCYRGAKCPTLFAGDNFTGGDLVKSCSDAVMVMTNEVVVSDTLITADITVPTGALNTVCDFQVTTGGDPTFIGADMVNTTTVSIPAHVAGDLILMFPYRNDNDAPTIPSGWTVISDPISATNYWSGVYYQVATGAGTLSGTWTSVNILGVMVLRDVASNPIGNVTSAAGGGLSALYPSNTFNVADTTSIAVGFGCTRGSQDATFAATAPTVMTNRFVFSGTNGSCGIHSNAVGVDGFDGDTVATDPGGRNGTFVVEVGGSGGSNVQSVTPLQPAGGPNVLRSR